jgi:hypothetical protein
MREHDIAAQITTMPDGELQATRRDLATGIALMRPRSPLYQPAAAYLSALDTELPPAPTRQHKHDRTPRRSTT